MSLLSIKNKRQVNKEQTLNKIIEVTRQLLVEQGIISLNTIEIARMANVAHGTVFSHFASKELLISHICQSELKEIAISLKKLPDYQLDDIRNLLERYLDLISENEGFFVILAKEFPLLNPVLQQDIISTEGIIRNILYQNIESGIERGIYKNIDITMATSFLMGSINFYLSRKEYFIKNSSIIAEKKDQLIQTFLEILIP